MLCQTHERLIRGLREAANLETRMLGIVILSPLSHRTLGEHDGH